LDAISVPRNVEESVGGGARTNVKDRKHKNNKKIQRVIAVVRSPLAPSTTTFFAPGTGGGSPTVLVEKLCDAGPVRGAKPLKIVRCIAESRPLALKVTDHAQQSL
jgi:hypothetical protein